MDDKKRTNIKQKIIDLIKIICYNVYMNDINERDDLKCQKNLIMIFAQCKLKANMAEDSKMINYHRLTGISNPDHPGNNVIEY